MAQEVAIGKRLKISKAQQNTLLAVLVAAIVLGIGIVFSIWLIKYISFNMKVINAKDTAIAEYSSVIKITGTCQAPADKNGIYSSAELEKCKPNEMGVAEVDSNTLRHKLLVDMAKNSNLEAVARESIAACYDENGEKLKYDDIYEQYEKSTDEDAKDYWFTTLATCSALRVIPDALPSSSNVDALLASLNQLFILSGWEPESLSPGKNNNINADLLIDGLKNIPVSLSLKTDSRTTIGVLNKIEQSIREFAISSATVKWNSETTLELNADATAYYIEPLYVEELTKEVKASSKGDKN